MTNRCGFDDCRVRWSKLRSQDRTPRVCPAHVQGPCWLPILHPRCPSRRRHVLRQQAQGGETRYRAEPYGCIGPAPAGEERVKSKNQRKKERVFFFAPSSLAHFYYLFFFFVVVVVFILTRMYIKSVSSFLFYRSREKNVRRKQAGYH